MSVREWLKTGLLVCLLVAIIGITAMLRRNHSTDVYTRPCDCATSLSTAAAARQKTMENAPNYYPHRATKLLSYQPPGNGWNNQRIALENALVLARLLNRTLVVHPLAPHDLGSRLKAGRYPGYVSYNMLNESDLLPLSQFMDLELMNQLVPVIEVKTSHPKFIREHSHLHWKNICHSTGFGYWVDCPQTEEEMELFTRQKFTPFGAWRKKCPNEQERSEQDSSPIVRFVSDLVNDPAEMLYSNLSPRQELYFAKDFTEMLNFTTVSSSLRNDLGIHEQCLCEAAVQFVPSPASTFDALILRHRGEVATRNGLMVDTLHTYWLGHQTVGTSYWNQTHTHP